jgi:hypothetical protein
MTTDPLSEPEESSGIYASNETPEVSSVIEDEHRRNFNLLAFGGVDPDLETN